MSALIRHFLTALGALTGQLPARLAIHLFQGQKLMHFSVIHMH